MTPSANTTPSGGPSAGGFCAACGAALSAGARFCHRCGTPVGQGALAVTPAGNAGRNSNLIPWAIAVVLMTALVANFAGKNFGKAKGSSVDGSANALATGAIDGPAAQAQDGQRAPDISQMSPSQRANRLYIRVMTAAENNMMDSAVFMAARMGIPAHEMLENPTIDERYHMAKLAEIVNDTVIARAQADTILKSQPKSLLGLMVASRAALMNGNDAKAKKFDKELLAALESELATGNIDYQQHRGEIDQAAADARKNK
ncbi:MAG: zinc ribbon domain-containing protein [Gemmatimonas sp.]